VSTFRSTFRLPEMYKVKHFGGDAIAGYLLPPGMLKPTSLRASAPSPNWTPTNLNATGYSTPVNLNPDLIGEFKVAMPPVDAELGRGSGQIQVVPQRTPPVTSNQASSNVINLQRRVSGVLPIRVDVPRAENSYTFVRPLVLDEETKMTFKYKSK
jgi:hypothetical protein